MLKLHLSPVKSTVVSNIWFWGTFVSPSCADVNAPQCQYHFTPSILGHTKAMEMFCTGRKMSAREAADRGLVTRLLDGDPDKFEERVEKELSKAEKAALRGT